MSPAARIIVELNIAHYRALLHAERDADKRDIIAGLLAAQERKLIEACADHGEPAGLARNPDGFVQAIPARG